MPDEICYHCSEPIEVLTIYDGPDKDAPAYHLMCYDTVKRIEQAKDEESRRDRASS